MRFVRKVVSDKVDLVATDEFAGYHYLNALGYQHEAVNHSAGEYVRGEVHTANIDSFWALLKRGIIGTYHHCQKKYLPLYLAEFQFRHNNRTNPDIFGEAIARTAEAHRLAGASEQAHSRQQTSSIGVSFFMACRLND